MKKTYLFPAILVLVLSACNNPSNQQTEIDDPATSTPATTTALEHTTMKGIKINIEKDALESNNFRKVLYTGEHMQLVLMSLKPGEEIGEETHLKSDQFFRFESGTGKCTVNGTEYNVKAGDVVLVPSGSKHNVINTGTTLDLKLYTIYAMPNHKDGIVRTTKEEATKHEAKFDGKTTE
jgi:mannose-6-phosphate isomerase-like protein (cupin superfamily)